MRVRRGHQPHKAPRLAFHGALSTSTTVSLYIRATLSLSIRARSPTFAEHSDLRRPALGNPRPATCVASCTQAPYAQAGRSRREGTGDFWSKLRGGRQWRRRWAESASPPSKSERRTWVGTFARWTGSRELLCRCLALIAYGQQQGRTRSGAGAPSPCLTAVKS